jgi:hypothetical protein
MKVARYFFVIVLSLVLTSCEFEETDLGFPKSITFTSNGGEKTIIGNESFVFVEIQDYKGNHGSIEGGEDGKLYNVYDWLRVEYVELKNDVLKVYAAPNTTDKDRTLYIEVYSGAEYDVITVKQGK